MRFYSGWLARKVIRLIFEEMAGEIVPNSRSAGNTRNYLTHGRIIVVADPGSNEKVWSVADSPVITKIVGGAGFDGNSFIRND